MRESRGLQGWSVRVYDPMRRLLFSNLTSSDGTFAFSFDGLSGTYEVCTIWCRSVEVVPGSCLCEEVAFGVTPTGIAGRVWHDVDGDRLQDPGEPGFVGWTVRLYRNGALFTTVKTKTPLGYYFFPYENASPTDTFKVCVSASMFTYRQTHDLDFPSSPNCSPSFTMPAGRRNDVDFGYQQRSCLNGHVWHDLDADGSREDDAEPGLSGWSVRLRRPNGRSSPRRR